MTVEYEEHLKSEYWQAVRNIALRVAGEACSCCGSKASLELHHKSYANLGCETLEDVAVLCDGCHEHHHFGERPEPEVKEVVREIYVFDGPDLMSAKDRRTADEIAGEVFGS